MFIHTKVRWTFLHLEWWTIYSECGHKTDMMNTYINFKTNSKKLQFGVNKCKKMHVGHSQFEYKCQDLSVDKWTEVEVKNDITGDIELKIPLMHNI